MTASGALAETATVPASWIRTRAGIALLLVLLYAGVSTVRWLQRAAEWPAAGAQDEITAYERRFDELRSELPSRGVVGYLGDPEPTGPTPRDSNAAALLHFRRYLLAQYTLAPLLLIESTEPELVVGNYDPGTVPSAPAGLQVVKDFGGGLVLFRRSGS
jgi:hypothetical protein